MRLITVGLVGIAALLATSVAAAAPQGGGAGQKGDTGGKGGLGPENSTQAGAAGAAEQGGEVDTSQVQFAKSGTNPDTTAHKQEQEKPWEISGSFETHHLVEQGYLASAALKTFNVYALSGRYLITSNDIVSIGGGAQQLLQADNGETGFRLFDIGLNYTHRFELPEKFNLAVNGGFTLPISYGAQIESEITSFHVGGTLSRKFGDLFVAFNLGGGYIWDKYTSANAIGAYDNAATSGSGATNTKYTLGGAITAEYSMPFHHPWSVGAVLADSYRWLYNVGQCPADTQCFGATTYPNIDNQPPQQNYGGEIFTRYILPDLQGIKSDITLSLANGDPSLGYPSVIHDGVVHPYFFYYNSTEVYLSLAGRY